jgi:putative transposase
VRISEKRLTDRTCGSVSSRRDSPGTHVPGYELSSSGLVLSQFCFGNKSERVHSPGRKSRGRTVLNLRVRRTAHMGQHAFVSVRVHFTFGVSRREHAIKSDIQPQFWSYIGGITKNIGLVLYAVGGFDDHVHVFVGIRPQPPWRKSCRRSKRTLRVGCTNREGFRTFCGRTGMARSASALRTRTRRSRTSIAKPSTTSVRDMETSWRRFSRGTG